MFIYHNIYTFDSNLKILFMKKKLLSLAILLGSLASAQSYSNGGLSTGATSSNGSAAPTGYTWSELQTGNTVYGSTGVYSTASAFSYRLADDFVVPALEKWTISSIDFFGYQTSATSFPFNQLNLQIWNDSPEVGSVIFGNTTTNLLNTASSGDGQIYRISSTPGTTRKIWKIHTNVSTELTPGTYWLDYQGHATNDSSGFFPYITILGSLGAPDGNAKQYDGASWADLLDTGSSVPQGLPFVITYTVTSLGVTETRQYDSRVVVYPNPVADTFKLQLPEESLSAKAEISLFDASGKKVKSFKLADSYNVSDLAKGSYILKVNDGVNTKVTKLLKK